MYGTHVVARLKIVLKYCPKCREVCVAHELQSYTFTRLYLALAQLIHGERTSQRNDRREFQRRESSSDAEKGITIFLAGVTGVKRWGRIVAKGVNLRFFLKVFF